MVGGVGIVTIGEVHSHTLVSSHSHSSALNNHFRIS